MTTRRRFLRQMMAGVLCSGMLVDALLRGGPEMGPPEEEVVETSGSTKLGDGDGVEWYVREYSNAIVMERPRRGVIRGITVP